MGDRLPGIRATGRQKRRSATQERNMSYGNLIVLVIVASFISEGIAQEDPEEAAGRFHENARPCSFRRQQGFCRRRSECKRPTRQVCRFGGNPIVCCLDEPERKTTTTTTTTRRPATTRRSEMAQADAGREIDLTFPGCGHRIPAVQSGRTTPRSGQSGGRRGIFSRGKRSAKFVPSAFKTRSKRNIQKVIVGGVTSKPNSWPWMVAIYKETSSRTPKKFLCGASLISKKYVLSAAHCFDGEKGRIDPSKFSVMVGAHTTKDGTEYPVENILIHSSYKPRQYYYDISLLKIKTEVALTQKVYPVCLPSDGLRDKINPKNNNVTVTGWGDTSFGGVSSKVLQELTIPIVPLKDCNESYSKLALTNFPNGINNLFICAGVEEGGKDACQGDSGGPLVSQLRDTSYAQLGVVSFGYGCAQAGFPGVYTRLSRFTRWLYENTDLGK